MRTTLVVKGAVALSAALLVVAIAWASDVSQPADNPGGTPPVHEPTEVDDGHGGKNLVYHFKVKPEPGKHIKDFHLYGKGIKGTPGKPSSGSGSGWGMKTGSTGPDPEADNANTTCISWGTDVEGGTGTELGAGDTVFTLTVPKDKYKQKPLHWRTTTSGDLSQKAKDTDDTGPRVGDTYIEGPCADVGMPPRGPLSVATTTTLPIASSEGGAAYHCYAVASTDEMPDPYFTYLNFKEWALTHALQPAWSVTFANETGTLDSNGGAPSFSVTLPNNTVLHGQHFYIVVVIDYAEAPDGVLASNPVEVTIE